MPALFQNLSYCNLVYNSKLMVIPIDQGTGTRIKIIEAMLIGAKILTTKKGIEGISFKKKQFPIVLNKNFIEALFKI